MIRDDLHQLHPDLIPTDPDIFVRDEWLPMIDEFFERVQEIYADAKPSICLHSAYESPKLKQRVRELVRDTYRRSRDV